MSGLGGGDKEVRRNMQLWVTGYVEGHKARCKELTDERVEEEKVRKKLTT